MSVRHSHAVKRRFWKMIHFRCATFRALDTFVAKGRKSGMSNVKMKEEKPKEKIKNPKVEEVKDSEGKY
jgi:hypothetical protein